MLKVKEIYKKVNKFIFIILCKHLCGEKFFIHKVMNKVEIFMRLNS